MKKKVDSRVQTLIENNIKKHQRSMLFLVGDRSRYQVVNFHYILTKQFLRTKPNVLWCYSKELEFSTNQKKRIKQTKSKQIKGLYDENVDDPFDLFVTSTQIRYAYYDETHKILGNTYQMLVLQDFQSLTPNILCRTIQTVEGGGLVIFLIKTLSSLKQLYTLAMDVHQRYRTQAYTDVEPRFNQRFILSLSQCKSCIFMDDQLNILPISSHIEQIHPIQSGETINVKAEKQLQSLKKDLLQKEVVGNLLQVSRTLDQAKVIMSLIEVLGDKTNKTTVSLNAARGRGKSAAIGLGIAAAIKLGYSSIFVTAPSPNNLKTLFEFVVIGLEKLGYKERLDFEKVISQNKEHDQAVMRIDLFHTHSQFIQFVFPTDADKIGHTDLVVIDQAAAIPLPYVKSFFGPHSVFLSSTINGYQGTGRSLSLKLIQQIKEQNRKGGSGNITFHRLKQVTMTDPIRYALDDQIQRWLNSLLLLNATQSPTLKHGIPHPNDCELFLVNRDALFSYKKSCQKFLFNLMSLFIASHYKNSPNDLQLLSDSPSHLVFVLVGPLRKSEDGKTEMPDVLCALQVALEGSLSDNSINHNSQRGLKPSGDLIPWNIRQQFQDSEFPKLPGARIVRIATHSMVQKMGYGSRTLSLLVDFFEKKLIPLENKNQLSSYNFKQQGVSKPLLKRLDEIIPPQLSYLGTSFGFTTNLVKFWRKNGFEPVYLRQTVNDITSEHSGIMLRSLQNQRFKLHTEHYVKDFNKRFMNLLGYQFKKLSPGLALEILQYTNRKKERIEQAEKQQIRLISKEHFQLFISPFDFKRLKSYANNQADYHLIIDLVPVLTKLYFSGSLGIQNFNYTWQAILVGVGLQYKNIEKVTAQIGEDKYNVSNSLALFQKALIRLFKISKQIYQSEAQKRIPEQQKINTKAYKNDTQKQEQIMKQELDRINQVESQKKVRHHQRIEYGLDEQDLKEVQQGLTAERQTITVKRPVQKARVEDFRGIKGKKKFKQ